MATDSRSGSRESASCQMSEGHDGEGAGGQGGRQSAGQAGDQPPGTVGADHAGQQPGLATDSGEQKPHIDAGIGRHDPSDGPGDPQAGSGTRVLAGPALLQRFHCQLRNQADDQRSGALVELAGPEGRERGQGDPVAHAGLGHDGPQAAAAGQVGRADHQIPAFPSPALGGELQEPLLIAKVEALGEDLDLPGHLVVQAFGQQLGQLAGQLLSQLDRQVRVTQQAERHAVRAPRVARHRLPPRPSLTMLDLACGTAWPAHRPERHPNGTKNRPVWRPATARPATESHWLPQVATE